MGILDKLKDKAVSGITRGVGNAVQNTAERKVTEAVQGQVDKTADTLIRTKSETGAEISGAAAVSTGGLSGLAGMMSGYAVSAANEAAKNLKICPKCEQPASADKKFCPACGTALPEQTLAAGTVCRSCGKQNTIGERFCSDCGTKLPFAEQEEQTAKARDADVLDKWDTLLPQYPKWNLGGHGFALDEDGPDSNGHLYYHFSAQGVTPADLSRYRAVLKQDGFRPAGEYPSDDMLYKRINGIVYCFESAEPFMSDPGLMSVSFGVGEPRGGFDYVKPEKKGNKGFFGLFKK